VVLIGKQWLNITDNAGQRRLDHPDDWVRLEIATLLERNIRVIPVLVCGATMPNLNELPECLARLSRRQALRVSDTSINTDINRLIRALEKVIGKAVLDPDVGSEPDIAPYSKQKSASILSFEPELVRIPPGTFLMGSAETEDGHHSVESPQHPVTLDYAFEIGKYAVTFDEYDAFAKDTGRHLPDDRGWGRGRQPVINVSFEDAREYVQWLSQKTGKQYRLPSEAEWEYTARAGSQTRYWWGDDIGHNNAVCDGCGSQWDNQQTAPVGSFRSNPFELFDTAGNVWEWTQDCWHDNYRDAPDDGSAWLEANNGNCSRRVVRGGSWSDNPQDLRRLSVSGTTPVAINILGFRVARDL